MLHSYRLNGNNEWSQFADLAMTLFVPFDQDARISFSISTNTGIKTHFLSRVMIDGVENR